MEKFKALFTNPRLLVVFLMGFASGMPFLLTQGTLAAWMRLEGIDLKSIGAFSLVGFPYMFKFLWSPFVDRFVPPIFGRRRGWLFIVQLLLTAAIFSISLTSPKENILLIVGLCVVIAFLSATQDIIIDAYRREILKPEEFGLGMSLAITAYRLGMLYASTFALILVGPEIGLSWQTAYQIMAAGMVIGLTATVFSKEPTIEERPPQTLKSAFIDPFKEFFAREGALWVLAFIVLYKVGDLMASQMLTPFYIDLKFTTTEIGTVGKFFGITSTIVGGIFGGLVMVKLGLRRSLWVFGILQASANLAFSWLYFLGNSSPGLAMAVTAENFTAGMGSTALSALMAALTNKKFTATQFALLSSLMSLPRILIGPPAGWLATYVSWPIYFACCMLIAIPGLLILLKIGKYADAAEN